MYNKLFSKIVTSSIWLEPTPTRMIWITFLALMDEDGFAPVASVANLAHTARIDLEDAIKAVQILESPDENSGDKDNDGRRIERVPGGWMVLNAKKYRDIVTRVVAREKTRDRVRRFREKNSGNDSVTASNDSLRSVTPSETYAVSEAHKSNAYEILEKVKVAYPAGTFGGQNWILAEKEIGKLLDAGESEDAIVAASLAYREQMDAKGSTGTQFIRSPEKFFGGGFWRGPFPKPDTPAARAAEKRAASEKLEFSALTTRAQSINFRAPHKGEDLGDYRFSLERAERELKDAEYRRGLERRGQRSVAEMVKGRAV